MDSGSQDASATLLKNYRPDINGLRAIAVISVILNHFDRAVLPLGHLGVDIFFVISGFVITSSIYHRGGGRLFTFWSEFYTRRFKRLFPALAACVLVTSTLICLVDPSPVASLRTGLSALFGLSNLYMLKQATDYFGTWANLNAFTHTWSLGVEEQFYLLFPFAVWATGFGRTSARASTPFMTVVAIASTISLIFYVVIAATSQPASFFLLPSRLWELGIGVLVFSATTPGSFSLRFVQIVPSSLVLTSLMGLLFLKTEAEVLATISAVGLSGALIASLRPGTPTYRLLTLPTISYLGRISYSLYLWHWSVICLSRWTVGLSWWLAPVQFGMMIALAATSYHVLEAPLRRARWSCSQLRSFSYGLVSLSGVAVSIVFLLGPGGKALFTGSQGEAEALSTSNSRNSGPPKGTLLLVGDSHAGHFAKLATNVSSEFGLRHAIIANGATPFPTVAVSTPVGGLTLAKSLSNAEAMERQVERSVAEFNPNEANIIILSSFYRFYFETPLGERLYQVMTHYDAMGRQISIQQSLDLWLAKLEAFASRNRNSRIIIFLSTPEMPDIYPNALCRKEWFRPHPSDKCHVQVDRPQVAAMLARLNSLIIQAVASSPNVSIFDPMPAICHEGQAVCLSQDGDVRLYSDEDHLTNAGSKRVEAAFSDFLAKTGLVR
jgi:peptidoglycan/LPS O-acetylase OafA/YrhL